MELTLKAEWIVSAQDFSYTGGEQTFIAPATGYYKFELWGAQGGTDTTGYDGTSATNIRYGGYGGYVSGQLSLQKDQQLYVYVGQQPSHNSYKDIGGWNGGGSTYQASTADYDKTAGGGATDVRITSGAWNNANSLRSRIIVASAGGGGLWESAVWSGTGGHAGGLNGYASNDLGSNSNQYKANGATQISGGVPQYTSSHGDSASAHGGFGYGGNGAHADSACGGGGGWYGGAGAVFASPGGGGSSYISGHTGSVAIVSTSSSSPKSGCTTGTTNNTCSISPFINPATGSGYAFTNTIMIDGSGYVWTNARGSSQQMPNPNGGYYASGVGHSGNGFARITYLGASI